MTFPKAITRLVPPADETPNKEFDETRICPDAETAKKLFRKAAFRLQHPLLWKDLTGPLGAGFQTHKASGAPFEEAVQTGDLLKIKVGGPLPLGADWVVVSHLVYAEENGVAALALQVHPCAPPAETDTEHFFDACATSTWIICRQGTRVSAHYRGRREIANRESEGLLRAVRDKIVAAAAVIGLADLQWKSLLKGFVDD